MNQPIPPPPGHVYDGATPPLGYDLILTGNFYTDLEPEVALFASATVCSHAAGKTRLARDHDALELLDALGLRDFTLDRIARGAA